MRAILGISVLTVLTLIAGSALAENFFLLIREGSLPKFRRYRHGSLQASRRPVVARPGEKTIVSVGGALIAIGMAVIILSPWPLVSALGFLLVGIGAANTMPVLFGAASRSPGVAPSIGVAAVATAALVMHSRDNSKRLPSADA